MNWNYDFLRFIIALNFSVGAVAVYGPFAIISGHPTAMNWIAALFFMIGWFSA